MRSDLVLHGYDASSYVFTVRILLAEKGADHERVPVHVLAGEARAPGHLALHPFGKVPVLVHDGVRIIETSAITRYLNDVLDGPSFVPDNAVDRARMDMAIGIYDSYGYAAMAEIVGYHRFPEFVGNPGRDALDASVARMHAVLAETMRIRGHSAFIAGERPSLADFHLAPACFYLDLVEDGGRVFDVPGFDEWWWNVRQRPGYRAAVPDLERVLVRSPDTRPA